MKSLYSKTEEFLNSLSHYIGLVLAIIGGVFLFLKNQNPSNNLGIFIYTFAMVLLYLASATYHGAKNYRLKAALQKIDHSVIYIFIPACFVIFLTVIVKTPFAYFVLTMMAILSTVGIFLNFYKVNQYKRLHVFFYLLLGWTALLFIKDMYLFDPRVFFFQLLGGIFYTIGVWFYKQKTKEYFHFIFHIFIILASISQYYANYIIIISS